MPEPGQVQDAELLSRIPAVVLSSGWPSFSARTRAILASLRLHQWCKNSLIFVPALAAHHWGDPVASLNLGLAFVGISFCASGIYLMNDLLDLASDRSHPYKKNRALANGDLPLAWGKVLAPLFIVAGLGLSLTISFPLMLLLTCYVSLATAYSLSWKQLPIVDVLCLTSFYTLRIYAGSIVSGLVVSKWLLMFSFFLFLSLALAKRVSDLVKNPGKVCGYGPEDSSTLSQMGTSAAYVSILVLAFYLASPEVTVLYRHPERLWGLCPLLFYWTSRLWLLLHRRTIHDDPVIFALQDRVTWTCGGIALVILGFAAS